jgi:hypothetical protein
MTENTRLGLLFAVTLAILKIFILVGQVAMVILAAIAFWHSDWPQATAWMVTYIACEMELN